MSDYRTFTFVMEIDESSEFRYPGFAMERARKALEAEGFVVRGCRNAHNETGVLPSEPEEANQ